MASTPLITIFTATYNRAHTLHRVFESLQAQTIDDFEWLVVDDGSTDGTAELVAAWANVASFKIRYIRQSHGGKHIAHNRALPEARGKFFAVLDSDDAILPDALETMSARWNSIPPDEQARYCAVMGLCCDTNGVTVGDPFPSSPFKTNQREMWYVHRIRGEKFAVWRTEVLRQFPFPELSGTHFIPEGAIWLEIAKTYQYLAWNDICRIYYQDDRKTSLSSRGDLSNTARGRLHYYEWLLNNDLGYFFQSPMPFVKAALMLPVVSNYANHHLWPDFKTLQRWSAKCLVFLLLPVAMVVGFGFWLNSTKRS